ncbi:arginyltransferase Ecym_7226 [Eremothecium cymbalariae DBVPG|uniref:arginyltransferase n=1 Tax=Eremothecium cymbalariae (strain CBS 270.75 / DBVPG 7215 / KCTC 17166 / NRRL Y-17582) TaxID=931890 RepID=G8JW57_ERECY|nr:hypothetical protein Ecym_7226 [Eremothecium cymbalariae DBVPG\
MELGDRLIISKPLFISEAANPRCGYCRGCKPAYNNFPTDSWYELHKEQISHIELTTVTVGLQVELLPVNIYDELCNMGFRRSGNFLYKADLLRNCCRLYTIRTAASHLKLSKELKSCIKKFVKRISNSAPVGSANSTGSVGNGDGCSRSSGGKGHGARRSGGQLGSKVEVGGATERTAYQFISDIVESELASDTFYTRFEPALFTQEKYELFVQYQEKIHNDHITHPHQFKDFLCASPFPEDVILGTSEEWEELNNWRHAKRGQKFKRFGPVHECYYYEGKLIALAVSDFLPSGISSVYFIWDPNYSHWSLGKLSALREIAITEMLNRNYYYLGYYIEDCPKMKYKAKYGGEILDVCNNQYVPLHQLQEYISNGKFFVLENDREGNNYSDEEEFEEHTDETRPLSELPLDSKYILDTSKPLRNIVERIYGEKGGAVHAANDAVDKLIDLGVAYTPQLINDLYSQKFIAPTDALGDRFTDEIYNLPNVVPGLVPLWEILKTIKSGDINHLNGKLMIYDTRAGQVRVLKHFQQESPQTKRYICNVIRLIGLKTTASSLIII